MSIANELIAIKTRMGAAFTADRIGVDFYDGTFSSKELGKKSFKTPSIFISCVSATPQIKGLGTAELAHDIGITPPPAVTVYQMDCSFAGAVLTGKEGATAPQLSAWEITEKMVPLINASGGEGIELTNAYDEILFGKGMFLLVARWRKSIEIKIGAQAAATPNPAPTADICLTTKPKESPVALDIW